MTAMNTRKYNDDMHAALVDAMRKGNYLVTACRLAGITRDTYYDWMNLARDKPDEYPEYVRLREDVELAKAESEAELLEVVRETALSGTPNTWQAAMTILERRHPDKFGKRDTTVIEGGENPIRQLTGAIVIHEHERGDPRKALERLAGPRELQPERPGNDRELEAGGDPE
jgi:hypothetical protein